MCKVYLNVFLKSATVWELIKLLLTTNVEVVLLGEIYFFVMTSESSLLRLVVNWLHVRLLLRDFNGIKLIFLGTLDEKK